jgi:hypothetical protein
MNVIDGTTSLKKLLNIRKPLHKLTKEYKEAIMEVAEEAGRMRALEEQSEKDRLNATQER